MSMVVDLAEEIVGGVLQHAELLRGAVVVAEAGPIESLRWAGALPLLLRDLGVPRVVSTAALWTALHDGGAPAVRALLQTPGAWQPHEEEEVDAESDFVDHVVVFVAGFLWEYEARLQQLVALGIVRRLVVCSSLSERAHECFDFGDAPVPRKMAYDAFAAELAAHNAFQPRPTTSQASAPPRSPRKQSTSHSGGDAEDEWGWGDDDGFGGEDKADDAGSARASAAAPLLLEGEVAVVHVPLNYAPLLHSKARQASSEPSLFVLSHPVCATAFPLLLTRVQRHHQHKLEHARSSLSHGATSPPLQPLPAYSNVKEVVSEHIPSEFRRTLKLVAYALGEMLVQARLDTKERIYALGNTSLKIGHTLLKILNELQEDLTTHVLQTHQPATIVLIDRTCDLASPCAFGVSLLDRVLALLPQSPDQDPVSRFSQTNRKGLHVTEIFPLHGCEPSPLMADLSIEPERVENYLPSEFVSAVRWKGGATLCHPRASQGMNVFRSLAFRPAKLALRDLDKRLQEVEKELVLQRKISRGGSLRKPGEKPPSTRGRDVVLRRMSNILEAGEPTNLEHSALIELGIIILETLERMECLQTRWDVCRERASRHIQLRKQGAGEWIIPELADTVQRQFAAAKSSNAKSPTPPLSPVSFHELLTLLVHACALSSGSPVEDYTIQLIKKVVAECIIETSLKDPSAIGNICPELLADLVPFMTSQQTRNRATSPAENNNVSSGGDEEDWDWDDPNSPRASHGQDSKSEEDEYDFVQAKIIIDSHMERILSPLKECAQLFAKQHEVEYRAMATNEDGTESSPRCLLSQLCSSLIESDHSSTARGSISELEHIVDASEQLARAGIDLLKSGFSRFGFGGSGASASQSGSGGLMGDSKILVVFVVGGVTFEEVQEVHAALEGKTERQVIIGGTTITNSDILLEHLFR